MAGTDGGMTCRGAGCTGPQVTEIEEGARETAAQISRNVKGGSASHFVATELCAHQRREGSSTSTHVERTCWLWGGTDAELFGPTDNTDGLSCGATVFHRNALNVTGIGLCLALDTVDLHLSSHLTVPSED